ncbi:hypothetical protein DERP_006848 [Dermatophagoides pteronyssinus]|uniref:Uncharacterized protein n=1 Tax=Dermatophagoides pteronyssinus TaxID=6956 RepID=A0ABQ8ISE6_DERPT|nr:hypothetical protein DERP_006848 [Dermatophagoides pteronyssinus]
MDYQLYSKFMIIVIIPFIDNVESIKVHGNKETEWLIIRFPYKSVYGIPNSLNCSESIRNQFYRCEIVSQHEWEINIDHYFYETKDFCCFVWSTLDCEFNAAAECNQEYSKKLKSNTLETFTPICNRVGSTPGSLSCWLTTERKIYIGIAFAVITVAIIICSLILYRINRNVSQLLNTKAKQQPVTNKMIKFKDFEIKVVADKPTIPLVERDRIHKLITDYSRNLGTLGEELKTSFNSLPSTKSLGKTLQSIDQDLSQWQQLFQQYDK